MLALAIAFAAWFWVQSQETDTARVRLNLDYRLPDALVASEPPPAVATAIVQGPRGAIRRAQHQRPTLVVDLHEERAGTHDAHLDSFAIEGLPSGLELVAFAPDSIAVRLEPRSKRSVEVRAAWIGQPAPDHDVRTVRVVPKVVEISGPRSVVERQEALSTLPIDVSDWDETRTVAVELDLPRALTPTRPVELQAEVVIESMISTRQLASVPVVVTDPGWRPADDEATITVKLSGPTDVLRAIRPDQVVARVDLPAGGARAGRFTATYGSNRTPRYEILLPHPEVRVEDAPETVEVVRR